MFNGNFNDVLPESLGYEEEVEQAVSSIVSAGYNRGTSESNEVSLSEQFQDGSPNCSAMDFNSMSTELEFGMLQESFGLTPDEFSLMFVSEAESQELSESEPILDTSHETSRDNVNPNFFADPLENQDLEVSFENDRSLEDYIHTSNETSTATTGSYTPATSMSSIGDEEAEAPPNTSISNCAICLDSLSVDDFVATNCPHFFCGTCLKKWLKQRKSCPLCQQIIHRTATWRLPK
jgi:hypothetical protein